MPDPTYLTDDEAAALREAVTNPTDRTSFPSLEEAVALLDERDALRAQVAALEALLREAYPYLPLAVSLAEELADMFPDIARPHDMPPDARREESDE